MKTAIAIVVGLSFVGLSVSVKNELRQQKSPLETLVLGEKMPDFTLKDASGADVSLSDVVKANKVVAINFWASWCGPCRLEMPGFSKLYDKKHGEGFTILGVNEDEKLDDMTKYLTEKPVKFPVLLDTGGELAKKLKLAALPTTILVNHDGEIVQVMQGVSTFFAAYVESQLAIQAKK